MSAGDSSLGRALGGQTRVVRRTSEFRAACEELRRRGVSLGFVPTMGALHAGHLRLVAAARRRAEAVAVSIFVNPTQFGPGEDFERYPRDLSRDVDALACEGVDLVFAPDPEQIYPPGEQTRVSVRGLGEHLCGPHRPGHFDGVATVVAKLFSATGPCTAVFGRKDYQQLKIVERMAQDLLLPVSVVGEATVRDSDGLALSSRNAYLSPSERQRALSIPRALARVSEAFSGGERRVGALFDCLRSELAAGGLTVQYAELAEPDALTPLDPTKSVEKSALVAIAAFAGNTRLIDNLVLGEDPAPVVPARARD